MEEPCFGTNGPAQPEWYPRPHRKPVWINACVVFHRVSEGTGGPNPLKKSGNAFVPPLALRVSMGGGNRLPSGDPYDRLPPLSHKKNNSKLLLKCTLMKSILSPILHRGIKYLLFVCSTNSLFRKNSCTSVSCRLSVAISSLGDVRRPKGYFSNKVLMVFTWLHKAAVTKTTSMG